MTGQLSNRRSDEAMLAYLSGDDDVIATARRVWTATGTMGSLTRRLLAAQLRLQEATEDYTAAIRACRIPAEHAERIGAALMLRLGRGWLPAEPPDDRDSPAAP